jgi:Mg-chelatase subunit ChlD
VKILQDPTADQPSMKLDDFGFTVKIPPIRFLEDGRISFAGYKFDSSTSGKNRVGRLFRAAVLHLTTHTLTPLPKEKIAPNSSDSLTRIFAKSIVRDTYVNAYLQTYSPDKLIDIAYASSLSYQKIKPVERIYAPSTKIMAAILTKISAGKTKGSLSLEEEEAVNVVLSELASLKNSFLESFAKKQLDIESLFDEKTEKIERHLEPFGPFLEAPSLSYTEQIGLCSIYTNKEVFFDSEIESTFIISVNTLSGKISAITSLEQCWRPEQEAEALQAFNSDKNQNERREKILSKISPYIESTRFKSVGFPEEDYTQYLRAKNLVQGTSRRLLEALRTALNTFDEDPRQEIGQLDLTAVIQAMASNKPATDVFSLDDYLKQSFAWSIILDVSSSMQVKGEYGRALAIAVAEAAKELMQDPTSWTFFAFSDRFYILKDSSESYSQRVRSRIGGLKFEGLTYIPDAMQMAGKMLSKRFEDQRVLVVISDGWPFGYENMPVSLKENVNNLLNRGVIVLGIGVETDRMNNFFRLSSSIYTPKDLVKKFANVFIDASGKAIET